MASVPMDDERRRASSQTSDTLRSTRSEQSPRVHRAYNSVSTPSPATPPLVRAPYRHSICQAPPVGHAPRSTIIAVSTPPAQGHRPRTASGESVERDSGNPSPDVTQGSERQASRSPLPGSESDSRSIEFDSLSVDESMEVVEEMASSPGSTVIHVTGDSVTRTRWQLSWGVISDSPPQGHGDPRLSLRTPAPFLPPATPA